MTDKEALLERAARHVETGRPNEAAALYRQIIDRAPDCVPALLGLGRMARAAGRDSEALDLYSRAVALEPQAEVHAGIASLLQRRGDTGGAMEHYRAALTLNPDFTGVYINLGALLIDAGRHEEARAVAARALALEPGHRAALNNMATACKSLGLVGEAVAHYRRALALHPGDMALYSNYFLTLIYSDSTTARELADELRRFGITQADGLRRDRPFGNAPDPGRRLRIGYVSPDFRKHAVVYFFEHLLGRHNRDDFSIFGYSNTLVPDAVTARLRPAFDHWRDISGLGDDAAADLIEADGIDILVDLAGHTARNSLPVFARKPAPVQVTWLGYPASTGMHAMDYRLTDARAEPPGLTEHLNVETLWRLPGLFCCYAPPEKEAAPPPHPPADDNGHITFGCFNNFAKVSDRTLAAWARILCAVPGSRLLLEIAGIDHPEFRARVERRLKDAGINDANVTLAPRRPENQLVLYNRVDIALDPFPCVGGTTTMDALWMGVPVVTLAGDSFVSRMGLSILDHAGLSALVSMDIDSYVAAATALATDRPRLRRLREGLRARVAASPVMDSAAFARGMEDAFRAMWRAWCARQGAV